MKIFILSLSLFIAFYSNTSANEENCEILDHSISPPDYAETEEEKILRLERELLLALEYYDGCLEVVEASSSSSPSASASAAGEQVQVSSSAADESANTIPADNSPSIEGFDDLFDGENGDTPEDIPEDSTDDLTAAQMKATARAEKDPVQREKYWDLYREYKGIKKDKKD